MQDILEFFSVLADSTRLNIVGLLAKQPRSGDELAVPRSTQLLGNAGDRAQA